VDTISEKDSSIYRFFCNHLVSLGIFYETVSANGEPTNDLKFYCYSGTILSIKGQWNFLTAGHVLEEIESNKKQGRIIIKEAKLIDYFGNIVVNWEPIPFDYENSPKFFVFDEMKGLDFGLILLSQYYRNLLEFNGIIAVEEKNWKSQPDEFFEKYWMIGLPKEKIRTEKLKTDSTKCKTTAYTNPAIISLTKISKESDFAEEKSNPFFYGKLPIDGYSIEDISGMSGGPIIGFNKDTTRYWIVAIQSSWNRGTREIFACKLFFIASLLESWLEKMEPKTSQ
jgi:hypothetical protein